MRVPIDQSANGYPGKDRKAQMNTTATDVRIHEILRVQSPYLTLGPARVSFSGKPWCSRQRWLQLQTHERNRGGNRNKLKCVASYVCNLIIRRFSEGTSQVKPVAAFRRVSFQNLVRVCKECKADTKEHQDAGRQVAEAIGHIEKMNAQERNMSRKFDDGEVAGL